MTKKKSKITTLVVNPETVPPFAAVCFKVGMKPTSALDVVIETMPIVKSISFSRHAYGQGAVVDEPCYFVVFENSNEVLIAPATDRSQVIVSTDVGEDVHTPGLPE